MAVTFHWDPGISVDQYETMRRRMKQDGAWPADGVRYHACVKRQDGNIEVFEVWDSQEAAQRFGEKLGPAMQQEGFQAEPKVGELHREERF
jgi:hypothetical protein